MGEAEEYEAMTQVLEDERQQEDLKRKRGEDTVFEALLEKHARTEANHVQRECPFRLKDIVKHRTAGEAKIVGQPTIGGGGAGLRPRQQGRDTLLQRLPDVAAMLAADIEGMYGHGQHSSNGNILQGSVMLRYNKRTPV